MNMIDTAIGTRALGFNLKKIVASWIFAHCLYEVYRARISEDPPKKSWAKFFRAEISKWPTPINSEKMEIARKIYESTFSIDFGV